MRYNIFCVSNDGYVPKCVVTLLSFRAHNPGVPLHIVGTKFSKRMKHLMKYHKIGCVEINLKSKFYRRFEYPVECYYHFWAPKIFGHRGFTHSVAVDGDLLCSKTLGGAQMVARLSGQFIGAVGLHKIFQWKTVYNDVPKYEKHLTVYKNKLRQRRPQTGVLFYNNVNLEKVGFSNEMARLYKLAITAGAPRKGDDSLLSLYVITQEQPRINYISSSYNTINPENSKLIRTSRIFHFIRYKPWSTFLRSPRQTTYLYLIKKWQQLARARLTAWQLKTYFPLLAAQSR